MGFGEAFLVEGATRTAFVRADRPATSWALSRAAFSRLTDTAPALEAKLLRNLLRSTSGIVERLSSEAIVGR